MNRKHLLAGLKTASQQSTREREYWLHRLSNDGEPMKTSFPYDFKQINNERAAKITTAAVKSGTTGELFTRLMALSRSDNQNLHMVLTAGLMVLLDIYSDNGSGDILVGTPIYRPETGTGRDFINTVLVLKNRVNPGMTFKELLLQTRETIIQAVQHQNYPLELLPQQLNISYSKGGDFPLFDVALLLENIHDKEYLQHLKYNITFSFLKKDQSLDGLVEYNSQLYRQSTIRKIMNHFTQLLAVVVNNPGIRTAAVEVLSDREKQQLLFDFNKTAVDYPREKTLHRLFAEQAARTPDHIAVSGPLTDIEGTGGLAPLSVPVSLTYRQLNEQSDRLAHLLQEKGVVPDTIVAIMLERSLEIIIGILAVLKAGAAYLPIDPEYPAKRIDYMLTDSGAKILLTADAINRVPTPQHLSFYPSNPSNLAYIIYTSGTTGRPKGVLVEHQNVVRLLFNDAFQFDFHHRDIWTLFHSYCFDFSVWEMYGALLYGGKLIIIPKQVVPDPAKFLEILSRETVTVLNQTPTAFYQLINQELITPAKQLNLRYVIFGGEALTPARLKAWKDRYPDAKLINMFGITETTVHVTYKEITKKEINQNISNIGKPIPTLSTFVLGQDLRLLPLGVPGELYVGGAGVARGYLNRPQLTAERFINIKHLYMSYRSYTSYITHKSYIYRSGDRVRWLAGGEMEYLGRIDRQVQLRGFRIELAEIEQHLLNYNGINDVVISEKIDQNGNAYLCAYIVPNRNQSFSISQLRDYLSGIVPGYMIPSYFVQLEKVPLTPNGKINRKALPEPGDQMIGEAEGSYIPPKSPEEARLVELWKHSLELETLGVTDNYFNIGGDSIKAIHLVNLINSELQVNLTIPDLYANETIEKLVEVVNLKEKENRQAELATAAQEIETLKDKIKTNYHIPDHIEDFYPMSDIETGMVFLSTLNPETAVYHDQTVYQVTLPGFDVGIFEKAAALMVEKHEILRTVFNTRDYPEPLQLVLKPVPVDVKHIDISTLERTGQEEYVNRYMEEDRKVPFDLSQPLWRIRTFGLNKDRVLVLLSCHHAIMDGWSVASFATELNNIYVSLTADPCYRLQKLKSSYKDYIIEQKVEKKRTETADFWKVELEGYKRLDIPASPVMGEKSQGPKRYVASPGPELPEQLTKAARRYNTSIKHLCFAAFAYTVSMLSYDNDIVLGLVSNNRPLCEDGDKILGCFLNTVPVRMNVPYNIRWEEYIRLVEEKLKQLKYHERLSLYEIARIIGETSTPGNPISDVLYNFVDFHIYEQALPGDRHPGSEEKSRDQSAPGKKLAVTDYINANIVLALSVNMTRGILSFIFYFERTRINEQSVVNYSHYFQRVLDKFIQEPGSIVRKDEIIPAEEKQKILFDFNATKKGYPAGKSIQRLFEQQVDRTPDHVALHGSMSARRYGDAHGHITYGELNIRSNLLAVLLRKKGVNLHTIVGIMVERSLEMITGILGILKAGGAYVPINPGYPRQRIIFMLNECNISILVTTNPLMQKNKHLLIKLLGLISSDKPVYLTGKRTNIKDLDRLPPANRSLVNYEKYSRYIGQSSIKNNITMLGSRGCPYNCAYCHKIWPKTHVVHSAGRIFKEIQLYYNMGVRRFVFLDDAFNVNRENSRQFLELIVESGLEVQLFLCLRGDILTKEYIDLMIKAGTVRIALALETASPRLQKFIGKNLNIEKFRENVRYICQTYPQLILEMNTMIGFPTETTEEALMTLDFIKHLEWLHFPYVHILKIYPNTDMEKLALKSGIPSKTIAESVELAYHELPETLPFEKAFTLRYQAEFFNEYFMSKERLMHVLPYQLKLLTEDEIVQKYNSYLPTEIKTFDDFLKFAGLSREQLGVREFLPETQFSVPGLNEKLSRHFSTFSHPPGKNALNVLLLDLSQYFTHESEGMLYDVVEQPLGLIVLMSFIKQRWGEKINGKIAKSRIDFDSYKELKDLVDEFQPDVIGIRTLTFYRNFFHRTIANLRQWRINVPIIAGGPYATSDYAVILQDKNVDLVVMGEGEVTFSEVIEKILDNNGKLPGKEILKGIDGLAYVDEDPGARKEYAREIVLLDTLAVPEERSTGKFTYNPGTMGIPINQPGDPAYVMFTSGTTGKPKGVVIEHQSVNNLVQGLKEAIYSNCKEKLHVCVVSPYEFDASVKQIFAALLLGHPLFIIPEDTRVNAFDLLEFYRKHQIDISDGTPVHLRLFLESMGKDCLNLAVKHFVIGGEELPAQLLDQFFNRCGPAVRDITNVYGPTECCDVSTLYHVSPEDVNRYQSIPIGKPLINLRCYILGSAGELQTIGMPGQLHIAGAGTARGYLNNPELTAEKFLFKSYSFYRYDRSYKSYILYKTGDITRWLPGGNIEYLGRIDHQVKIRGFRIEPAEIRCKLENHPLIKDAVVIDRADKAGDKYLCAYIVSNDAGVFDKVSSLSEELNNYLSERLPNYMIPSYFVPLTELPLTPVGKINRSALPDPVEMSLENQKDYIAPRDDVEKKMTEIWKSVLGRNRIGINDNFFMIGGDSIKIIQIISRLKAEDLLIEMKDIFSFPTISQLAGKVRKSERCADQSPITGIVPLTPIQARFFKNSTIDSHYFNQAVMLYWEERFDIEAVKAVFTKIQEHHDALRMIYEIKNNTIIQKNRGLNAPLSLQVFDLENKENALEIMENKTNEIQAGINLEKGPLMKLGLFRLADGDRLLVAIHHLVIDGVSWRILFEDIEALYQQYKNKEPLKLPLKTDSFKRWAQKLRDYSSHKSFLKDKSHWEKLESTPTSGLIEIEKDFQVDNNFIKDMKTFSFRLNETETESLLTRVNHAFGTEINDILLTALGMGIKQVYGNHQLLIAMEGHGREDILADMDISRTVGWFTCVYPVLLNFSYLEDLPRQVIEIKEALRRVPNKGIGYGILRYLSNHPLSQQAVSQLKPQVSFNYLGQFDADVERRSFGIASESAGRTQSLNRPRHYELEIVGMIVNNRLQITLRYNKNQFKGETVETLMNHYQQQLVRLISFCAAREKRELTPSDLTYKGLSIDLFNQLNRRCRYIIEDIYRLTPMQEGMLFHALYDRDRKKMGEESAGAAFAYFEQISYRLQGNLDTSLVEKSLNELFKRYDILRTTFVYEGIEHPLQIVLKTRQVDFYYEDIHQTGSTEQREQWIREFKEKDKRRGFDLAKDVLMRVSILRTEPREYEFTWSFHHILMDGWCMGLLNSDFFEILSSFRENRAYRLPEAAPYKTYIKWLEKQDKETSKNYWAEYLYHYEEPVGVPGRKRLKPGEEVYEKARVSLVLTKETVSALNTLAAKNNATLNTAVQAAWGIILGKYNAKNDVVFGAVVSGRPAEIEDVERMVGLFINTVPVRIRFHEKMTFIDLVQMLQAETIAREAHYHYPLARIQTNTILKQDLFDHIFVFENYPINIQPQGVEGKTNQYKSEIPHEDNEGITVKLSKIDIFEQTNYNLNVLVIPGDQITIRFEYNRYIYDRGLLEGILNHLDLFLQQVTVNEKRIIADISLLSREERNRILLEFNDTASSYMVDKPLHQLFEEQVDRNPDNIAGIFHDRKLTYKELNRRSNQLAEVLREKGVLADTIVGIMMERSIEMIIAILGILGAGGAYLPLDPDYPEDRINYMLSDSNANVLLTTKNIAKTINFDKEMIHWNSSSPQTSLNLSKGRLFNSHHSSFINHHSKNLAYIIYTSGSTGKPRGVMVEQRSVINLAFCQKKRFQITCADRILQFSSISFDASVEQIFISLYSGAGLVMVDRETLLDKGRFEKFLFNHLITHIHAVPSFLKTINSQGSYHLKRMIAGGDICSPALAIEWYNICEFYNEYGPTETTVTSIEYLVEKLDHSSLQLPIGKALDNTTVYILDRRDSPVPYRTAGELFIGGDGVARGYLNNPELTADKFCLRRPGAPRRGGPLCCANRLCRFTFVSGLGRDMRRNSLLSIPSSHLPNFSASLFSPPRKNFSLERVHRFYRSYRSYKSYILYKTGDLACWLPDGNIEFLGRMDNQVKVRGFRIEPGEIEALLLALEEITDAVVVAPGSGEKARLYAYIVPKQGHPNTVTSSSLSTQIKEYLAKKLPEYMIPSYFVELEKIPLTPGGKIDKKGLPLPSRGITENIMYIAPENENEKIIANIWKDVLNVDTIGVEDNFFDLGGNSIDFIKITNKLKAAFNRDISIVALFRYPTIRNFSRYLHDESFDQVVHRSPKREKGKNRVKDIRRSRKK